jgi:hypothetical protein
MGNVRNIYLASAPLISKSKQLVGLSCLCFESIPDVLFQYSAGG